MADQITEFIYCLDCKEDFMITTDHDQKHRSFKIIVITKDKRHDNTNNIYFDYKCGLCGEMFKEKSNLINHLSEHDLQQQVHP